MEIIGNINIIGLLALHHNANVLRSQCYRENQLNQYELIVVSCNRRKVCAWRLDAALHRIKENS